MQYNINNERSKPNYLVIYIMKITKRQYMLLRYLIDHACQYFTSETLGSIFDLSSRTIKNDLNAIKIYVEEYDTFQINSIRGKGILLEIIDSKTFGSELIQLINSNHEYKNDVPDSVSKEILKYFVTKRKHISKQKIMNNYFISESTFYKIYNNIKITIAPFNLKLENSKSIGYSLIGKEKDIRNLISNLNLFGYRQNIINDFEKFNEIYNYIVDTFIDYKYKATEVILQNIATHVIMMYDRVSNGNCIDSIEESNVKNTTEYQIAYKITSRFIKQYVYDESLENETVLLTQTILGKVIHSINKEIQSKVNTFILKSFISIKEGFSFNFDLVENLKVFLTLHTSQLIYRINSGTQIKNHMADEIEKTFPPAHDIALYFSILFEEEFSLSISKDELSYLSLYFNYGIQELELSSSSKKILIITKYRPSEIILLKHKIMSWFPNQLIEITIVDPNDNIEDLSSYDSVLTTELYYKSYENTVTLINIFPTEEDYKKISIAVNGYNIDAILDKFNENCFFRGNVSNKTEAIQKVYDNSKKVYSIDEDFFEHLISRENVGSTYFGNSVAIPHPFLPLSQETFISIAILETPIMWDSEHSVELVMLISIEKNNPRAFQFWHYFSTLTKNKAAVINLLKQKNYSNFIRVMEELIAKEFNR